MKPSPHVLVVDDNEDIVTMLRHALSRHGFRIDTTTLPEEALQMAEQNAYDAALLDLVMPGRDGAALAAAIREKSPGMPVGILTAATALRRKNRDRACDQQRRDDERRAPIPHHR